MRVKPMNINILQWNINNMNTKWEQLLHEAPSYDILFIQEYNRLPIVMTKSLRIFEPNSKGKKRAIILVQAKTIYQYKITQVYPIEFEDNGDVVILYSETLDLYFINVYNDPSSNTLNQLDQYLQNNTKIRNNCLISGDMNAHHVEWETHKSDKAGRHLMKIKESFDLHLHTPKDLGTFSSCQTIRDTTIDLTFTSQSLENRISEYEISKSIPFGDDHKPIRFTLHSTTPPIELPQTFIRNYKKANWTEVNAILQQEFDKLNLNITTRKQLQQLINDYKKIVSTSIEKHIPGSFYNNKYHKPWWNDTLNTLKTEKNKKLNEIRSKIAATPTLKKTFRRQIRRTLNEFYRAIRMAKSKYLDSLVEESFQNQDWNIFQKITKTKPSSNIPFLRGANGKPVESWDENFNIFKDQFFTESINQSSHQQDPSTIPIPPDFIEIQIHEMKATLNEMSDKSPGPDKIPLIYLCQTWDTISPILCTIYNGCIKFGHHPEIWKFTETIILPKPGKPDYGVAKAYRPIALSTFFTRVFESLMTKRLTHFMEINNLFSEDQHGFRKHHNTTDGLLKLIEYIKSEWKKGNVVSILTLDLSGAYDNVDHEILIKKMQQLGIPNYIIQWTKSFISNRTTYFSVDGKHSPTYQLSKGLPQGSPISPILFLIFSIDLVTTLQNIIPTSSYADDLLNYVGSESISMNNEYLEDTIKKANDWAIANNQTFSAIKTEFMHCTPNNTPWPYADRTIQFNDTTISPNNELLILGITIDPQLTWKQHILNLVNRITRKWNFILHQCRKQAKLSHGARKMLYKGIIEPIITYGSIVWKSITKANLKPLEQIFYKICRQICGAIINTNTICTIHEAGLTPIRLRLAELNKRQLSIKEYRINHKASTYYAKPYEKQLSQFNLIIPSSKMEAIMEMGTTYDIVNPDWISFTDGSVNPDVHRAGAGVMWTAANGESYQKSIRLSNNSDIFDSEKEGMYFSINSSLHNPWENGIIFTDSASNIQKWKSIKSGNCPFYETRLKILNDRLRREGRTLTIQWIPGHFNIYENEIVDELAKAALSNDYIEIIPPPNEQQLKRNAFLEHREAWCEEWKKNITGKDKFLALYPKPLLPQHIRKIHNGLSFTASRWLTWCRTNCIPLQATKFARNTVRSPTCPFCNLENENLTHFLFYCPKWKNQRKETLEIYFNTTNPSNFSLNCLLANYEGKSCLIDYFYKTNRFNSEPPQ